MWGWGAAAHPPGALRPIGVGPPEAGGQGGRHPDDRSVGEEGHCQCPTDEEDHFPPPQLDESYRGGELSPYDEEEPPRAGGSVWVPVEQVDQECSGEPEEGKDDAGKPRPR